MSSYEDDNRRSQRLIPSQERPKSYFDLIVKVGDSGKYQKRMLLVFMLSWFVSGIILLSTAFLFKNSVFDCNQHGILLNERDCSSYVCQLPQDKWQLYKANSTQNRFHSIATTGNYLCKNQITINIVSGSTYFGAFFGFITISFLADNFGRKKAMLISWGICVLGCIIVASNIHIYITAVGLFLSGFGSDAAINLTFLFFGQVVGKTKRQRYSVLVQILFATGALTVTLFFYIFQDWKVIWYTFVTGLSIIQLILLYCYIEQTPQFLIEQGLKIALDTLNRIGSINQDRKQTLEEQDIESVIQHQITNSIKNQLITPIDILMFPSLRMITLTCGAIAFMTYAMYYGPALIIHQIGLNIYMSSFLVQLSELLVYIPALIFIQRFKRKQIGVILFSVASSFSFVMVFLQKPDECDMCAHAIIQLIVVFIFRGCVSLFFCIFHIYMCQLFPSRIRGIGMGMVSAIGTLASTISPLYLSALRKNGIDIFNFFTGYGIIAICCLTFIPQTLNLPMKQEIQQVQLVKEQQRNIVPLKSPKIKRRTYKSQLTFDKSNFGNIKIIQSNLVT